MKTLIKTIAIATIAISTTAMATTWVNNTDREKVSSQIYFDTAEIVSIEKKYKNYTFKQPYETCYNERVKKTEFNLGGALLGGIIGNQMGGGDGKKALTILGAVIGANSGNADAGYEVKEVCETNYKESSSNRLSHYKVTYRYNGQLLSYRTKRMPSEKELSVSVQITPTK
jgi:uncharacterized protein YcfJ